MNDYSLAGKSVEEQNAIIALANKDRDVMGAFILANENLVWHTIHKYLGGVALITSRYRVEKDDLYQIGCVGIIKAIKAFDPARGNKFATLAVTAVYREIKCFLRDSGDLIRLPRMASDILYVISDFMRHESGAVYMQIEDMAEKLNVDPSSARKAFAMAKVEMIDEWLRYKEEELHERRENPIDAIPDDFKLEDAVLTEIECEVLIDKIMERLNSTEQQVLMLRLDKGLNQIQTANAMGIKEYNVSHIVSKIRSIATKVINNTVDDTTKPRRRRLSKYDNVIKIVQSVLARDPNASIQDIKKAMVQAGIDLGKIPTATVYYIKRLAVCRDRQ